MKTKNPGRSDSSARILTLFGILIVLTGTVIDFVALDLSPRGLFATVVEDRHQSCPRHDNTKADIFWDTEQESLDDISETEVGITEEVSCQRGDNRQ